MAKSLGEINYEYLIEVFGAIEGHEDFFTSDDGDEVLVIPKGPRTYMSAESEKGADAAAQSRIYSGADKASAVFLPHRRVLALDLLLGVLATFGRAVAHWVRRGKT
jgi:hypothetical protein